MEETVYHVVLASLRDRDLQARCTSQALLKQITDINTLVNFCSVEESSKLGSAPTVAGFRKSGYKQQKTNTARQGAYSGGSGNNGGCRNCGGRHSSYTVQARKKE